VTDDLHPDRVARLTAARPLPQDLVDEVLDATPTERAVAARMLQERSVELLREAGVLPPRAGTVLDLRGRQAAAISAMFGTVAHLWLPPSGPDRALSDALKVASPREVAWVVSMGRWGGLVSDLADPDE
jgi:hypothetical protein